MSREGLGAFVQVLRGTRTRHLGSVHRPSAPFLLFYTAQCPSASQFAPIVSNPQPVQKWPWKAKTRVVLIILVCHGVIHTHDFDNGLPGVAWVRIRRLVARRLDNSLREQKRKEGTGLIYRDRKRPGFKFFERWAKESFRRARATLYEIPMLVFAVSSAIFIQFGLVIIILGRPNSQPGRAPRSSLLHIQPRHAPLLDDINPPPPHKRGWHTWPRSN
jgi:hypothetical protein